LELLLPDVPGHDHAIEAPGTIDSELGTVRRELGFALIASEFGYRFGHESPPHLAAKEHAFVTK
jgi:hypothetical protein